MRENGPLIQMTVGGVLLAIGAALPLLMVIQVLPSTFPLNFLAYGSSVVGLVLGLIGAFSYMRRGQ